MNKVIISWTLDAVPNEKMELSGFQFDGAGCDMASVLLRVQTKTQYTHRRVKESHRKDA